MSVVLLKKYMPEMTSTTSKTVQLIKNSMEKNNIEKTGSSSDPLSYKNDPNTKSSKKKDPTTKEWNLVKENYEHAKQRNLEEELLENEKHLILKRDEIYNNAKKRNINDKCDDKTRLKVVEEVVSYLFLNVEPPNQYTKNTDIRHFKEVAALAVKYCKKQNKKAPITLIISCWFHDIERFIPCTKCKYLPEVVDKYRKQLIHPQTSARVAMTILKGSPITEKEKQRIYDIIVQHDKPIDKKIEFLDKIFLDRPANSILWELQVLMDADALAFFTHTIVEFINYKKKKNTPQWIWTRIMTNIKRLRPKLRIEAINEIKKLDDDLRESMGYNDNDIESILHQLNIVDEQGTTDDNFNGFESKSKPTASNPKLTRLFSMPTVGVDGNLIGKRKS